MTHRPDEDRDLEALFSAARRRDERALPSFARVVAGSARGRPRPAWRPALAVGATAFVLAAGVWWLAAPSKPELEFTLTAGDLRVPTDVFLDQATFVRAGAIPRLDVAPWPSLSPIQDGVIDRILRSS